MSVFRPLYFLITDGTRTVQPYAAQSVPVSQVPLKPKTQAVRTHIYQTPAIPLQKANAQQTNSSRTSDGECKQDPSTTSKLVLPTNPTPPQTRSKHRHNVRQRTHPTTPLPLLHRKTHDPEIRQHRLQQTADMAQQLSTRGSARLVAVVEVASQLE